MTSVKARGPGIVQTTKSNSLIGSMRDGASRRDGLVNKIRVGEDKAL